MRKLTRNLQWKRKMKIYFEQSHKLFPKTMLKNREPKENCSVCSKESFTNALPTREQKTSKNFLRQKENMPEITLANVFNVSTDCLKMHFLSVWFCNDVISGIDMVKREIHFNDIYFLDWCALIKHRNAWFLSFLLIEHKKENCITEQAKSLNMNLNDYFLNETLKFGSEIKVYKFSHISLQTNFKVHQNWYVQNI